MPSVEPRMWTTVRISVYRPFCAYVVPIRVQLFGTSNHGGHPRTVGQPMDRRYLPWDTMRSGSFTHNAEQREVVLLWLARHIAADGEHAEWVSSPRLGSQKATLNLVAKFFWLLVRNRVSPTKADNALTWDRAVMVAALVAGFEINFARMLLAQIHERAFKTSTTYPFSCLIFQLCKDSGVLIWHYDKLIQATGTLDIGLIRDEATVAAPRRGSWIDVLLGTDLVDVVEQILPHQATLMMPRPPLLRPLVRPPTHLETPRLLKPLLFLQLKFKNWRRRWPHYFTILRADIDSILATPTDEPESAPNVLVDDTVLGALFSEDIELPEPTRAHGKRHRSSHNFDTTEEARAKKRERQQTE
uniref:Integrase core domain containing protein n=1 Tax=Solanum tuberosum TaxID=4113 RepID=M1DK89_SOLTU